MSHSAKFLKDPGLFLKIHELPSNCIFIRTSEAYKKVRKKSKWKHKNVSPWPQTCHSLKINVPNSIKSRSRKKKQDLPVINKTLCRQTWGIFPEAAQVSGVVRTIEHGEPWGRIVGCTSEAGLKNFSNTGLGKKKPPGERDQDGFEWNSLRTALSTA